MLTAAARSQDRSLSRRSLLKIVTGSAGAAVSLSDLLGAVPQRAEPVVGAASSTSVVSGLPGYSPVFFSPQQIQTLAVVSDLIIPDDNHSPGARAARVFEYMDTIVSESNSKTKQLWVDGLAALDAAAKAEQGKAFVECTAAQQAALLEKISRGEDHPATIEEQFFVAVKRATIAGYYTSKIGIHKELEYQGNTALADFPGCQHPVHKSQ